MASDLAFMQRALALAQQGEFTAHPNPCVGCVLVRDNQIVGEGLHWQAGLMHAECEALAQAQEKALGATCYVTLEPCVHVGRTGPCVQALIKAQVKEVVIATLDPNPLMAGKGVLALKAAGIAVQVGLLEKEAQALNIGFFSRMLRQRPFVRAKIAMSLDGRIAMAGGESQWITALPARERGQVWRARSGAIITGRHTVMKDNCRLTVRQDTLFQHLPAQISFKQPLRIVIDSDLTSDPRAAIFQQPGKTLVAIREKNSQRQTDWLKQVDPEKVGIVVLPEKDQHIDLQALMHFLAQQQINDVLIEGGSQLMGALLEADLIDELLLFVAPIILGATALPLAQITLDQLSQQFKGDFTELTTIGSDVFMKVRMNDFGRHNDNPQY